MKSKFISLIQRLFYRQRDYQGKARVSTWVRGIKNFEFEGENIVPEFCVASGKIKLGYRSTLGVHNFLFGNVTIGKYCQIGGYCAFHGTNHPIHFITTYINQSLFRGELKDLKNDKPIVLGNDIWVGHGVTILSGVNIGDGAILAAGSVVTKDVEPYTIVAGNPAKPIRKRFSDAIIVELVNLQWWNKTEEELEKLKPLFFTDLSQIKSIKEIIK
jgi:acetyltransferase-like isoleucine patch superfamily enzyme